MWVLTWGRRYRRRMTTGGFTAWSALGRAVGSLRLGDHVCCWYHDDEVRTRAAAARPGGVRVAGASPLLTRLIEAGTAG